MTQQLYDEQRNAAKKRLDAEEELYKRTAAELLLKARAAAAADPEDPIAKKKLFVAEVRSAEYSWRNIFNPTPEMMCGMRHRKGCSYTCQECSQWRSALYSR